MPSLDLFLHDRFVGVVEPDRRDRGRVVLAVDPGYQDGGLLLSEAFATLPGCRPPIDAVSNFLGGYVPEGNHREQMAAKRHISKDDLFALLNELGGSIAGAVTLRRQDETSTGNPAYEPLSDRALEAKLKQAIKDSDQGIPDDSRSALPDHQPRYPTLRPGARRRHGASSSPGGPSPGSGARLAPKGISTGVVEHLQWTVRRLLAGSEVSEPKR